MPALNQLQMHYYYYQHIMAENERRIRRQDETRAHAMLQSVRHAASPERPGSVSSPNDSQSSSSSSSSASSHYPSKMLHNLLSADGDRRDLDNASPRSVSSGASSYGYNSPSPRSSPSPPTPATANKLYDLLKNPTSTSYNAEETWRSHQPAKRKHADEPMDLSCKKRSKVDEEEEREGGSILEGLLCGRRANKSSAWDLPDDEVSDLSVPCSPCPSQSSDCPVLSLSSDQIVGLAKKVLLPVTARVSDWVVKIISYAQSLPEFTNLSFNDRVTLILNSWARLLLLCMAETSFEFAVTPKDNGDMSSNDSDGPSRGPRISDDLPTMRGVESIQGFIRKCQCLSLDNREYEYLKTITLFNPGRLSFFVQFAYSM